MGARPSKIWPRSSAAWQRLRLLVILHPIGSITKPADASHVKNAALSRPATVGYCDRDLTPHCLGRSISNSFSTNTYVDLLIIYLPLSALTWAAWGVSLASQYHWVHASGNRPVFPITTSRQAVRDPGYADGMPHRRRVRPPISHQAPQPPATLRDGKSLDRCRQSPAGGLVAQRHLAQGDGGDPGFETNKPRRLIPGPHAMATRS